MQTPIQFKMVHMFKLRHKIISEILYHSDSSVFMLYYIFGQKLHLSYDVVVFQWITSCHKNRMTTRVITLLREYVTSLTTSVTTM